jgi:hypothetical protein
MKLNETATATLRDAGISPALWARANYSADGIWYGDACGCPDDRCIGYHHGGDEDCGCLDTLLADFLGGTGHRFADGALPPVRRLDGRWYHPQKLTAEQVTEDGELTEVLVFGTHNPDAARPLADALLAREIGREWRAEDPAPGWWRDGFRDGERHWLDDGTNGRAGVLFRRLTEVEIREPRGPVTP